MRDFTGGCSSAHRPEACMSSPCRPHVVGKRACRPRGMATALHKASWLLYCLISRNKNKQKLERLGDPLLGEVVNVSVLKCNVIKQRRNTTS